MQIQDVRPEPFTKQIRCDRCGRLAELGEVEFHESISIESKAGYGSVFGDGNDVQVDLCQHCLKTTLGPWLRVTNQDERRALLEERLRLFDLDRHGGEFPTDRDIALQLPDDMPVQERPSLDGHLQVQPIGVVSAPEGLHARSAQLWPLIRHSALLFFAPLTGAVRGIRREYKRLNHAERSRQRDQAESARRGLTAIDHSKGGGDG